MIIAKKLTFKSWVLWLGLLSCFLLEGCNMSELMHGKPFYVYADDALLKDITINMLQSNYGYNYQSTENTETIETLVKDGVRYPVYLKDDTTSIEFYVSYKKDYAELVYLDAQFFSDIAQNKNILLRQVGDKIAIKFFVSTKGGQPEFVNYTPQQWSELRLLMPIEQSFNELKAKNKFKPPNDDFRKLFFDFFPVRK